MKRISAFSSKGSMKFLFSTFAVIIIAFLFLTEKQKISDYIFTGSFCYYVILIFYYKYKE